LCHLQVLNTQLAPVVANLRNPESPLSGLEPLHNLNRT